MDAHFLPEASATDVTGVTNHSQVGGRHGTVTKNCCNTNVADEQAVLNSVCVTDVSDVTAPESRDMLCTTFFDNAFTREDGASSDPHTKALPESNQRNQRHVELACLGHLNVLESEPRTLVALSRHHQTSLLMLRRPWRIVKILENAVPNM